MKRLVSTVVLVAMMLGTTVTANAAERSSQNPNTKVLIGQDVTKKLHYTLTWKAYGKDGSVLTSKTFAAPAGTLITSHETTLADAEAHHERYVVLNGNTASDVKAAEKQLDKEIARATKGQSDTNNLLTSGTIQPDATSYSISGQFWTGAEDAWAGYTLHYTGNTYDIWITEADVWMKSQPTGWLMGDWLEWGSQFWDYPESSIIPVSPGYEWTKWSGSGWESYNGDQFYVELLGNNGTHYEGWVTPQL